MAAGASAEADALIGRAAELHEFDGILFAVRAGQGRAVLVSGEAGIGKTRLCEEVVLRARRAGFVAAWGSCWLEGGAPPLWPWQEVLAGLCGRGAVDLLDGDSGIAGVDPERFSRFTAIVDRLRLRCDVAPVVIVIDDVHAADPGAVLLARFVVRTLRAAPLLLVASRRAGESASNETDDVLGAFEQDARPILLRRFDIHETCAFLRVHGADPVESDLALAVLRVTGGNPLFLARVAAGGGSEATAGGLADAIRAAAGRLAPASRRLLCLGAVLGRSPSMADVAAVAGVAPDAVLNAIAGGARAGLVEAGRDRLSFTHELIREVLEATLEPVELLDAHARAATVVSGRPRRAQHALRAASRSAHDARLAVEACRAAATEMVSGFAYEQAATLLASAAAAYEAAALGPLPAALLVEWAEAMLSCGRLGGARGLFDRAVDAADREDDASLRGAAALGLGGVWVSEQRTSDERERVRAIQRRALTALPKDEEQLRTRLEVRIAAETAYPGRDAGGMFEALERARRVGDGFTLAEALSLTHHALLTPEHAHQRVALADELVAVASACGAGLLGLMGLCWRTVDLFLLGDPAANRALAELRGRADALRCQGVLYIVATMDVMLLIREGRLVEAEAAASACYDLGVTVGDADAIGYLGGQLLAIRWAQGREAELLETVEEIAGSPTLAADDIAYPAAVAFVAAAAGEHARARAALDRLAVGDLAALPRSSTWLTGMAALVEAARALGDRDLALEAYRLMAPYADQVVMPSLAIACFGSVERPLGVAAHTFGDDRAAAAHLERSITVNQRIGNRAATAISKADLAQALVQGGRAGDRRRAAALLREAVAEGNQLGLTARARDWSSVLAALEQPAEVQMRREGAHWLVSDGTHKVVVSDLVGMGYLARLVANPGVEVSALELAGAGADLTEQLVLDGAARATYERRARDLMAELSEAEDNADLARAEQLRIELEMLVEELSSSTRLGGRTRAFAGPRERARTSVRKALKRAIEEVAAADAELGAHLRTSITTGTTCVYVTTGDPFVALET